MKRFLFIAMFALVSLCGFSQNYVYRTTSFAYQLISSSGVRSKWSNWQSSNVRLVIDATNDRVVIYSQSPQVYRIVDQGQQYTDRSGGRQVEFSVIDQDGDRGTLRLRIEKNGNSQVYVDFLDVSWVYNVQRA